MFKLELLASGLKVPVELAAVVCLHVFDFPVEEDVQAVEEIAGRSRAVGVEMKEDNDTIISTSR
jgi:hypothetical protein